MDAFISDIRYALRTLTRSPGFTVVAVLTLALGIGANTALFSVVDAVLLRPLPYADADQLVVVTTHQTAKPSARNPASLPEALDWREQAVSFSGLAAFAFNRFELNGPEGTDLARAALATGDFFAVLKTPPLFGRVPTAADDNERVVVLSHQLWMRRYNGDRSVIGRTVRLYNDPFTIIGVMAPGFHYPTPDVDLWMSLASLYASSGRGTTADWVNNRSLHGYRVVARLKPGVTLAAAEHELNAVQQRLAQTYPNSDQGIGVTLTSVREQTVGNVQRALWLLLGAAGFVLLIACANIAHLLLARTTARGREIAVRQALGANRWRLGRQLITESVTLAALGGGLGVLIAVWGAALIVRVSPADIPRLETVAVNGWVLAFAAGASVLAGVLFGLAPVVQAWRGEFGAVIGGAARGVGAHSRGGRFRQALMSAEVAVALVLLIGTGLMVRSFALLLRADPGFPTDHLLTFHITVPNLATTDAAAQAELVRLATERLRALPGVSAAGAATSMPPTFIQQSTGFSVDGRPAPAAGAGPSALWVPATPGYLTALGAPMVAGRDFTDADRADALPVMVVNEGLARDYFPGESALGQRITVEGLSRTIVGVVGDMKYFGLGAPADATMYVPFAQKPFAGVWVVMRTATDPLSLTEPVRAALHQINPDLSARAVVSMEQVLAGSVVQPRFQTSLLATFGIIALLLAGVGIYGVIGYGVAQRTGEIGVRLALGASTRTVLMLIVRQGMAPVLLGLGLGVVASLALTRALTRMLYNVTPTDVPTFVAVTLFLGVVALVAAYVPARRAARVDPMVALRHE